MQASIAISASSSRVESYSIGSEERDKVSAVYMCLPGMCCISKSNRSSRSQNLKTRGGNVSRCFSFNNGTSGLWSVST